MLSFAGELGVLLAHEQEQVRADEPDDDEREDQHVQDEEARDDRRAGEVAAEEEEREVGADERDREHDRVRDPDTRARDEVVGQRVAEEAVHDREDQQREPDRPVELARLAEGAGEEDARHVHDDRADEDVAGPVVHLAHQQSAAHREGEVDRRVEGLGDLLAVERQVGAVVDTSAELGHEVERQEDTRDQQDDEGVERDLAEHEGPVVGEDLVHERPPALGDAQAVVELVEDLPTLAVGAVRPASSRVGWWGSRRHSCVQRSQKPGPTGWS